jgi:hypothetical protein
MPVITCLAPRISLAAIALGAALNLALASAAFAGDPMSADTEFRNSLSGQGGARTNAASGKSIPGGSAKKEGRLKNYVDSE